MHLTHKIIDHLYKLTNKKVEYIIHGNEVVFDGDDIFKKQIDTIQLIINKINTRDIYKCVYSETFYTDENITHKQIFDKIFQDPRFVKYNLTLIITLIDN